MIDIEAIKRRLCDARVMLARVGLAEVGQDIDALIAEVERLRSPAVLLLYGEPFESHPCEIMADPPGSLIVRCKAMEAEVERLRAEVALRTDERNALAAQVEVYARGVTVRLVEGNE